MKTISIGRDSRNDIPVDERWDTVSNRHGEITFAEGNLIFTDHSSNGTVINGQRIHNMSVGIYPGDVIMLANVYELSWDAIGSFFPHPGRPTVTRNSRGVVPEPGRSTIQMNSHNEGKSRETEIFGQKDSKSSGKVEKTDIGGKPVNPIGRSSDYSQARIDDELERWNWGAFLGNILWGAFNGIYWPLLLLVVVWVPYLGQVATLCVSVFLGFNGSRMAWRSGIYRNFSDYLKTQRTWIIVGSIWFAGVVVGNVFLLKYMLTLL